MRNESSKFIGQQGQSAQREADDDRILYTDNYGGLNTESSPISIPLADSPSMLNMEVTISGRIKKRDGSILRSTQTGYSDGYLAVPISLPTGEVMLWEKVGAAMYGSIFPEKETISTNTTVWTFSDLFSTASLNERPHWVLTKEFQPRLIMVQPSTVPVELEFSLLELVGDGDTTITYPGDWTGYFGTSRSYGVYGTTTNKLSSISHTSGVTTFTFTSSITSGQRLTLVQPTFHWWAEAVRRTSDQLYATALQFATSIAADANIEVPTEIKRGIYADYISAALTNNQMPAVVLNGHNTTASAFTFDTTPASNAEYAWSNLEYTAGAGEAVAFGSTYLTFGGIPASTRPLHIVRFAYLPFNGGTYAQGQNIGVYNPGGYAYTWRNTTASRTTAADQYWLLDSSRTVLASGSGTTLSPWLRMDASVPFGGLGNDVVIVNKQPNSSWVGSLATSTYYNNNSQGSFRPIYGLADICNYQTGVFPTIIALYQNRIALSGISAFPNKIYLSNIGSENSKFNYQNFQIYIEDSTIDSNPIEVEINGISAITGMVDWFNSLFIFTKDSVKRIYSPNQLLTPTSKTQSDIATIGCKSPHAITKTDRNVVFLSSSGLYKVDILEQTSDYYVESVSLKVESLFKEGEANGAIAWVTYDSLNSVVYVGTSVSYDKYINHKLYVFFTEREAWSEYALYTGYFPNSYGVSLDGRIYIGVVDRASDSISTQPSSSTINYLTEFSCSNVITDLVQSISSSSATVVKGGRTATVTITVNTDQRIIDLRKGYVPTAQANYAFKYLPIEGFYHVTATYNATPLTAGTDFVNLASRNAIRFLPITWATSATLVLSLKDEDGYSPVWVQNDNELQVEGTDYTLAETSNTYQVTPVTFSTGTTYAGFKYMAYHSSPVFFRQGHRSEKRTTHYIGYYSNKNFIELYTATDGAAVADQYKLKANVNVAVVYNDSRAGYTSTDIYTTNQVNWDTSVYDSNYSPFQQYDNVRLVQPIIGIGYNLSVVNFSFSPYTFELIGYSMETVQKGKNSRAWF
jgi:hypothetical protein